MRLMRVAALTALLTTTALFTPAHAEVLKSNNVRRTYTFPYPGTVHPPKTADDYFKGGTDIAFQGKWIYAMQQGGEGGVHIIKRLRNRRGHVEVNFFKCPGEQNDVAVVEPGLIAISYHETMCGGTGGGMRLVDVSEPKRPRLLGAVNDIPSGSHTLTVYPGKPIVYLSPGGLANSSGNEQIVNVSDPKRPKVVGTYKPSPLGCHDLTFSFRKDGKYAFCAGEGETQIWDVSDPKNPVTITHIPHAGQMVFPHSVAITHDGKYAFIGDENFQTHDCEGGPTGAIWIYDIRNIEAPVLVDYYSVPRGQAPVSATGRATWCTAHLFNFIPNTYILVSSWYAAGMNVVDFSDIEDPKEIAYYMGTGKDYTNYWSAYWHRGRIYANDRVRGLDVFRLKKGTLPGR